MQPIVSEFLISAELESITLQIWLIHGFEFCYALYEAKRLLLSNLWIDVLPAQNGRDKAEFR
jgi:hypothetical protein